MTDQRLRDAERRHAESGALEDEVALVQERLRAGRVEGSWVELAAELGSPAAQAITGLAGVRVNTARDLAAWGEQTERFAPRARWRLVTAEAQRLLELCRLGRSIPGHQGSWLRVAEAWCDRLVAWTLTDGPSEQADLLACEPELDRASQSVLGPAERSTWFEELHAALAHAIPAARAPADRPRGPRVWSWTGGLGPRCRVPDELPRDLLAALAREVVPWALGHHDPLRRDLDRIRVASPCDARWSEMPGDEQVRFCAQCGRNVYDISRLGLSEARALVARAEDRLCVRLYRREDGTVLTSDCPDWVGRQPEPQGFLMGDVLGDV